jgi:hypothetical protein
MPHAKPIINDDTVAALTRASCWPKMTLTGSVDCRKKPPIASTTTKSQPDRSEAARKKGGRKREGPGDHGAWTEAIRRAAIRRTA